MWLSIFRWLAAMAVQQGAKRFFAHVWDDITDMMMAVWEWLVEKVDRVCSLFRR